MLNKKIIPTDFHKNDNTPIMKNKTSITEEFTAISTVVLRKKDGTVDFAAMGIPKWEDRYNPSVQKLLKGKKIKAEEFSKHFFGPIMNSISRDDMRKYTPQLVKRLNDICTVQNKNPATEGLLPAVHAKEREKELLNKHPKFFLDFQCLLNDNPDSVEDILAHLHVLITRYKRKNKHSLMIKDFEN